MLNPLLKQGLGRSGHNLAVGIAEVAIDPLALSSTFGDGGARSYHPMFRRFGRQESSHWR
jgi:hypothetical protein